MFFLLVVVENKPGGLGYSLTWIYWILVPFPFAVNHRELGKQTEGGIGNGYKKGMREIFQEERDGNKKENNIDHEIRKGTKRKNAPHILPQQNSFETI